LAPHHSETFSSLNSQLGLVVMSVSWQAVTSLSAVSVSHRSLTLPHHSCIRIRCSSLTGSQEMSTQPLESRSGVFKLTPTKKKKKKRDFDPRKDAQEEEEEEEEGVSISTIQVPRQKYIPVPKAELLDAIVLMMFQSHQDDDDSQQFLLLSS
jgi:hypothetical protein